ncbi:MAG: hypothetical protein ABIU20_04995 [Blastocatellia bacterium]
MRLFHWVIVTNAVGLAFGVVAAWPIWRNGLPPADIEEYTFLLQLS